jgi:hypothetical protein
MPGKAKLRIAATIHATVASSKTIFLSNLNPSSLKGFTDCKLKPDWYYFGKTGQYFSYITLKPRETQ